MLLIRDPAERRRKEAENGSRQFSETMRLVGKMGDALALTPGVVCELNRLAIDGVHSTAGEYRTRPMVISNMSFKPPDAPEVPELVEEMCEYANDPAKPALHVASYLMWRLNWIHPFDDGNGRTSRAVSYLALCVGMGGRLPGTVTVPDLISADKTAYYEALDSADAAFAARRIDVGAMESLLEGLLAKQFVSAIDSARDG